MSFPVSQYTDTPPEVKTASLVVPDNWKYGGNLFRSDWLKAQWYLNLINPTGPIKHLACNVTITGKKIYRRRGENGWMRCSITFVGDGTPDSTQPGWILLA